MRMAFPVSSELRRFKLMNCSVPVAGNGGIPICHALPKY
jgi:hypothetical protein